MALKRKCDRHKQVVSPFSVKLNADGPRELAIGNWATPRIPPAPQGRKGGWGRGDGIGNWELVVP
ncbi:hypothetical protein [Microcoleus sp. EPA2]|uniref:hypothetical protein n=1 Tax=Microcoleus sp. EPA2 TaxID=2841654 RepID=UPI00312BCB22